MSNPLELLATQLAADPNYKVLRRYQRPKAYHATSDDPVDMKLGALVDVETTGLDPLSDRIIELAIVQFEFSSDGTIYELKSEQDDLQDPGRPIPALVTRLTGLNDKDVKDQHIDRHRVQALIAPVSIVIAHNAAFDRRFLEDFESVFASKAWGCSMTQVPWLDHDIESTKLEYIAYKFGFFYERHRALADCLATIHLLAQHLPGSEQTVLASLLTQARQMEYRLWAINAPFESKDKLKVRGYHWNSGEDGRPKAWFIDTKDQDAERLFLQNEIYGRNAPVQVDTITAFNRFSQRV